MPSYSPQENSLMIPQIQSCKNDAFPSFVTQMGNLTLCCYLKEIYNLASLPKLNNIFTAFSSISFT